LLGISEPVYKHSELEIVLKREKSFDNFWEFQFETTQTPSKFDANL